MNRFPFAILAFSLLLAAGCYRKDTLTTNIRAFKSEDPVCADHIVRRLAIVPGIVASAPGESGYVTVEYDAAIMSLRNVEHAVAAIGFDVQSSLPLEGQDPYIIKAATNAVAQLPPECR